MVGKGVGDSHHALLVSSREISCSEVLRRPDLNDTPRSDKLFLSGQHPRVLQCLLCRQLLAKQLPDQSMSRLRKRLGH